MHRLCPHSASFQVAGETFLAGEIIEILDAFLTPERRHRIRDTVAERTYTVVPVMEGVYDRGNVSAVIRSAEALGYQAIHIIDSSEDFKEAGRVTQGAEKWLDITVWEATSPCVDHLRSLGYRIVATHLDNARPIGELAFDTPTALFFGNEKEGLSEEVLDAADERVVIPMAGFTRSFNISVAAALCLYHIQQDRLRSAGCHGDLDDETRLCLTASYYLRSVPHAELILRHARRPGGLQKDTISDIID